MNTIQFCFRIVFCYYSAFTVHRSSFFSVFVFALFSVLQTSAQPVGEALDTLIGLDKVFRTSDIDNNIPTTAEGRRNNPNRKSGNTSGSLPRANRIGCLCMDYEQSSVTGKGACSGHGGVRFWLSLNETGDTVREATWRHQMNPDTLYDKKVTQLINAKRQLDEAFRTQQSIIIYTNPPPGAGGSANTPLNNNAVAIVVAPIVGNENNPGNGINYAIIFAILSLSAAATAAIVKKYINNDELPDKL